MVEQFLWILCIAIVLVAAVLLFFFYRRIQSLEHKNKQLSQCAEHPAKHAVTEDSLRYKLDPHLLKNALNAIQSHAYHSYHALDKLSNVLDYILYETDDDFVKLTDEITFANNLIDINRIKINPLFDLHVRKKIPAEAGELLIAPFVTINPIENAFKHADVQSENSFISVIFEVTDTTFILSVTNKVYTGNYPEARQGGLGNKTYIARLDKLYPGSYKLSTEHKDDTYRVRLELKLQSHA